MTEPTVLDKTEETKLYVDMWKATVEVQKHFNDIEIRIRGLALTVLTFTLGAAAVAMKDKTFVLLFHHKVFLSSLELAVGVVVWATFYFVDQVWYHRLLVGSVVHGMDLETEICKVLPRAGLTKQIKDSSPYVWSPRVFFWHPFTWSIQSATKLRIFYGVVGVLLVAFSVIAQFGSK